MALPVTSVTTLQDPVCGCFAAPCKGFILPNGAGFNGPQLFNGAQYVFGQRPATLAEAAIPNAASVFKSTDGGATWHEQDAAHAPIMQGFGTNLKLPVVFDAGRGFLHICYEQNGAPFDLIYARYNMNTDTWGAPVDAGFVISTGIAGSRMTLRSNGDVVLFFTPLAGDVKFVVISGQAFGAVNTLVSTGGQAATVWASATDGSDTSYIAYSPTTTSTALVSLTVGGVISAPSAIASFQPNVCSWMLLFKNRILIPYISPAQPNLPPATATKANFWEGTPINAPVWTSKDLHDGLTRIVDGSPVRDKFPMIAQFDANNVYFVFSLELFNDPNPGSIVSLYAVSYDGTTVGSPVLLWDELAHPAPCATGFTPGDYFMIGTTGSFQSPTLWVINYAAANQDLQGALTLAIAVGLSPTAPCPKNSQGV